MCGSKPIGHPKSRMLTLWKPNLAWVLIIVEMVMYTQVDLQVREGYHTTFNQQLKDHHHHELDTTATQLSTHKSAAYAAMAMVYGCALGKPPKFEPPRSQPDTKICHR